MKSRPAGVLVCAVVLVLAGEAPARPSSPRLVAANIGSYRDNARRLWVFGEVTNRGPGTAADVGVLVKLASKDGRTLTRGVALKTSRNVLRVGEKAVWLARMHPAPKSWARLITKPVEQVGRQAALAQDYRGFTVHNAALSRRKVSGEIVNTGSQKAKVGAVVVAFYDARQRLVFVTDQGLVRPQIVPAKKRGLFEAAVADDAKRPAHIVVSVRASTAAKSGFYLP